MLLLIVDVDYYWVRLEKNCILYYKVENMTWIAVDQSYYKNMYMVACLVSSFLNKTPRIVNSSLIVQEKN